MTNDYYHIASQLNAYNQYYRNGWSSLVKATDWDVLHNPQGEYSTGTYASSWYTKRNGVAKKPQDLRAYGFDFNLPSNATPTRIYLNVRMRIVDNIDVPVPSVKFGLIAPNQNNWNNTRNEHDTGWHNGFYVDATPLRSGNRERTMSRAWWLFNYEIPVEQFRMAGFSPETFNNGTAYVDVRFRDAITKGNHTCEFQLGYVYMSIEYTQPNHDITFTDTSDNVAVGDVWFADATYTQSDPLSLHGGTTTYKISPQWGEEILYAEADNGSSYDPVTKEWTVNSVGSQTHTLHMSLKSHVVGNNTVLFNNNNANSFVYDEYVGYGVDSGFDGIKVSLEKEVRQYGKACAIVSIEGYSSNDTNQYQLQSNNGFRALGWEIYDETSDVSIQSQNGRTVTLNVPLNKRFKAYLKVCFIPYDEGENTFAVKNLETGDTGRVSFNITGGVVFHVSSEKKSDTTDIEYFYCPTHTIKLRSNRIFTDVGEGVNILPFRADDGDAVMTQSPIKFHLNKMVDLDYIGCVPLEHLHFNPKSTYKDTLINTNYKNKRYMGKKLASDEDITLNVRLHPPDVTTIQGLIDMDKPIPINANHKCFEGDALNHRGWAEIYSIKAEKTNPHWYKCDIDVKYLTHNLHTRLNIERGNKVCNYPISDVMIYVVNRGDNLSTDENNYFKAVTDGTFEYVTDVDESLCNLLKLNNGEHLVISSRKKLANVTSFAFEWTTQLLDELKENNVSKLVRLVDKDGNSVFEYEYTDYEYTMNDNEVDSVSANVVYRIRTPNGWENVNKQIKLRTKLSDGNGIVIAGSNTNVNQILFGSTIHLELNNNQLKIIDEGFNGKELSTENAIELIDSDYFFETEWRNNNSDAETQDSKSWFNFIVQETMLQSDYATKYAKCIVSPFPVAKKHMLFTRESEEGVLYYYEDDGEEFSYMIEPFYVYQNGTDLKTSDGISIFNLNYGYEVVYIQNGLVRMGFNRINGQVYLGKYDNDALTYITTHNLQLEKYSDINIKSISDDKIEIQVSDTIFTIWRGHPYIMINHPTEDILIDTKFNRVWAEGVGTVTPSEYPEYWDLQNDSNLLPLCVGGTNEVKTSCVETEEINVDRTNITFEWASTSSSATPPINDWDNITVGQDNRFVVTGSVNNPSELIDLDGYKSMFGEYTVSEVTDHSVQMGLILTSPKDIIVKNENTNLQAFISDYDGVGIENKNIYFYERYQPISIIVGQNKDAINKGEVVDITASLKDEDGSGIPNEPIYFYEKSLNYSLDVNSNDIITKGSVLDVSATYKNENGRGIANEDIWFYDKYTTDTISLVSSDVTTKGTVLDLSASFKDEDGSGIADELIWFYDKYAIDSIDINSPNVVINTDTLDLTATLKDEDGSGVPNEPVYFYDKYTIQYLRLHASADTIQLGNSVDLIGFLGDEDGSGIGGETVGFDRLVDGDWVRLGNSSTDSDGSATYTYSPNAEGTYSFRMVKGLNTTSTVTVTVESASPTIDSITLTATNPIIQSGGTTVLTATALDSGGQSVTGVTLDLYKGSNVIGTVVTGGQGYTYTGTGAGDTVFYASDGTIQSETYTIEDCLIYDTCGTDKTSDYSNSYLTGLTFDTDHYIASRNSSTSSTGYYSPIYIDGVTLPTNFEASIDLKLTSKTGSDWQYGICASDIYTTTYSGTNQCFNYHNYNRCALGYRVNGSLTNYGQVSSVSIDTWYKFIIKVEGTSVTSKILKTDDTVVYTTTQTLSNIQSWKKVMLIIGGGATGMQMKNYKVKPL